ncbi:MAG: PASTA domain-containing protein [Pseudomonadota bacterium]
MVGRFFSRIFSGIIWFFASLWSIFAGAYLIALYILIGLIVVFSLTAFQARTELASINNSYDFDYVLRLQQQIQRQSTNILESIEEEDKLGKIDTELRIQEDSLYKFYRSSTNKAGWSRVNSSDMEDYFRTTCNPNTPDQPICISFNDYIKLKNEKETLIKNGERDRFTRFEADALKKIDALFENQSLTRYFAEVKFFGSFLLFQAFLTMPHQLLVFIVTIAMGALGALISVTWSFLRYHEEATARRVFLLPIVGSMSAFVIFVLLKAGQITITAGGSDEALSPFFLSFVGIVSGLLAERSYKRVSDVGERFLSSNEGSPRWGDGLLEAAKDKDLSAEELADILGVSVDAARGIIHGTSTATDEQQKIISAALRTPSHELFTDIPQPNRYSIVPRLEQMELEKAKTEIERAGLKVGRVNERYFVGKAIGQVIEQSPEPFTKVKMSATVELVVSVKKTDAEGSS